MLDLIGSPAFCVSNNKITRLNEAAARLFLREGISMEYLLESGAEEYAACTGGTLYVSLRIHGQSWGASVVRIGQEDVFTLDQLIENPELRALALAALELRGPLSNAILAARQLSEGTKGNPECSRLNRGLAQLLRIVGNMSDASNCGPLPHYETRNVPALLQEIVEKAAAMTESTGIRIRFDGINEDVLCPVDVQLLERAVLNMISNAVKFSPKGSTLPISVRHQGSFLRLSVTDEGTGMAGNAQNTLFRRYLREPAIEDNRCGIGLGMLIIRNAAARHGGAVLVDQPEGKGTRVSVTICTAPDAERTMHSVRLTADYAGELDHALLELSEYLPPDLY